MQEYLKSLVVLTKQKRLIPAEQIMCNVLYDFERKIPKNLAHSDSEKVEDILLKLHLINGGMLSIQCCMRLSECLLHLYEMSSPPRVGNIFVFAQKNRCSSIFLSVGHVIDVIGASIKSVIPGFAKLLTNAKEEHLYAAICALTSCFKRARKEVSCYTRKAFLMAKCALNSLTEPLQLSGIRLLRTLLKQKELPTKSFLHLVTLTITKPSSTFVIDDCCYMIAKLAYMRCFDKETGFKEAFELLSTFPDYFPLILRRFIDIMDPEVIFENLHALFKQIRRLMPGELGQLIALVGPEARRELFQAVASEDPPSIGQLNIIQTLQFDDKSMKEAAALGMQLAQRDSAAARNAGSSLFAALADKDHNHASLYLETALLYLAYPPDENPNISTDIRAFSSIASEIMMSMKGKLDMTSTLCQYVTIFLDRALSMRDMFDAQFVAAFSIMATVSETLIPKEKAIAAVNDFLSYVHDLADASELVLSRLKYIAQAIAMFLEAHSGMPNSGAFWNTVNDLEWMRTPLVLLAMMLEAPKVLYKSDVLANISDILIPFMLSYTPSVEYTKSRLKYPMSSAGELLHSVVFKHTKNSKICPGMTGEMIAYRIIECFADFIASMNADAARDLVHRLVLSSDNYIMSHSLLLSVVRDSRTKSLCPSDLHTMMLSSVDVHVSDWTRVQITTEVVGIWAKNNTAIISECLKIAGETEGPLKCFIYSAVFAHSQLAGDAIANMMHDMDNMALNSNVSAFALHALSVLYNAYLMQLSSMKVTDMQCQVLLNLLNNQDVICHPYNLYNAAICFVSLLPIVSPEIKEARPSVVPLIRLIIRAFYDMNIPYAKQIMFHVMRSVFAFARDLGGVMNKRLQFPIASGSSIPLKLAAAGVFSDMLRTGNTKEDYFQLVPDLLVLLQRSEDNRASEFVETIAEIWAVESNPQSQNVRDRLSEWISILKTVLAVGNLPSAGSVTIEASSIVQGCMLQVGRIILPVLCKSMPLMTENLDDLITCVIRSIGTPSRDVCKPGFALLEDTITSFRETVGETGDRLLLMYDSQFSMAVRSGFQCDLTFSGQFLIRYLRFHLEDLKTKPEDFESVIQSYLKGIRVCRQRVVAYFAVISTLSLLARSNKMIYDLIREFAPDFVVQLCEIVSVSMALWESDPLDWQQIANFRANYSEFYRDLLVAFIWLQETFEKETIPVNYLFSFLIRELKRTTESWRIRAAFDAISVTLEVSSDKIEDSLIAESVELVKEVNRKYPVLTAESVSAFLAAVSSRGTGVIKMALDKFHVSTIAKIIRESDGVESHALDIFNTTTSKYLEGEITEAQFTAIFTLLLEKTEPSVLIDAVVSATLESKVSLALLERALKRCPVEKLPQTTGKYVCERFIQGGMYVIAHLFTSNPDVACALVMTGHMMFIMRLVTADAVNASVYLQFLGFAVLSSSKMPLAGVAEIAISAIRVHTDEAIVKHAVQLLNIIRERDHEQLKSAFYANTTQNMQSAVKSVEQVTAKKSVGKLKLFSTTARKLQDQDTLEWVSLD